MQQQARAPPVRLGPCVAYSLAVQLLLHPVCATPQLPTGLTHPRPTQSSQWELGLMFPLVSFPS